MTPLDIHDLVTRTLREDLSSGDPTTDATVPAGLVATGEAFAKGPLTACGGQLFEAVFAVLDSGSRCEVHFHDGARVEPGQVMWTVRGNARALLMGERAALNLTQRASGVATLTRQFVDALPEHSQTRIADTRKTTPGLRAMERHAVRCGGGHSHRDNLGSAVMIKDNHIVAAGGIRNAIVAARNRSPHTGKLEVEVADLQMLDEALAAGADIVMLDNFEPTDVERAVQRARGRALTEVSGNVGLERVAALARAGVDVISVGALTHSAPAADISMKLRL
jgi:nicotinate-nucleotide pyrophosphorylase (carboxylating)